MLQEFKYNKIAKKKKKHRKFLVFMAKASLQSIKFEISFVLRIGD